MVTEEQVREQLMNGIKTEGLVVSRYEPGYVLKPGFVAANFKFDIGDRVLYCGNEYRVFKREYLEESLSLGKFDRRKKEVWYTLVSNDGNAICSSVRENEIKKMEG